MLAGGQFFSSHLYQFDPGKEHLYLLNRWQGRRNSWFRYCGKEKNNLLLPAFEILDRLTKAYSLIGYDIPAPTAISKYLSLSCTDFQSHWIMTATKSH
jgi:hypothetical protein